MAGQKLTTIALDDRFARNYQNKRSGTLVHVRVNIAGAFDEKTGEISQQENRGFPRCDLLVGILDLRSDNKRVSSWLLTLRRVFSQLRRHPCVWDLKFTRMEKMEPAEIGSRRLEFRRPSQGCPSFATIAATARIVPDPGRTGRTSINGQCAREAASLCPTMVGGCPRCRERTVEPRFRKVQRTATNESMLRHGANPGVPARRAPKARSGTYRPRPALPCVRPSRMQPELSHRWPTSHR